jgi:hypothetical protein
MNSLSWMIYWAGVLDSLAFLMSGVIALSVFSFFPLVMGWMHYDGDSGDDKAARAKIKKFFRRIVVVFISVCVAGVFLPSGNTIYAIAASEYGEEALKMPEASKARQALNAWLDAQITEKKP